MSYLRCLGLLMGFAAVALALVEVRAEQARSAASALAAEAEWIQLRRELWSLQTQVARLRTPTQVHDRVEWFNVGISPPGGLPETDYEPAPATTY